MFIGIGYIVWVVACYHVFGIQFCETKDYVCTHFSFEKFEIINDN